MVESANNKLDKRMYVLVDCPVDVFPEMVHLLQAFSANKKTIMAVVGNLSPFETDFQQNIRKSINEACKTHNATASDWIHAVKEWHEKTNKTHTMQVVEFTKREEECEAG